MKRYSVSLDVWCPVGSDEALDALLDFGFLSDIRRGYVLYRLEAGSGDGDDLALMLRELTALLDSERVLPVVASCEKASSELNIAVYSDLDNSTIRIPKEFSPCFSGWSDISVSYYYCE